MDITFIDDFVSATRRKVASKLVIYCDNYIFSGNNTIYSTTSCIGRMLTITSCNIDILLFNGIINDFNTLLLMSNNDNIKLIFLVLYLSRLRI